MNTLGDCPSTVVGSVQDFKSIFTSKNCDCLLLCYEADADSVTISDLVAFQDTVRTASHKYGTKVKVYLWECSADAFTAARMQLKKKRGMPLLLVVYKQEIADTFPQPFADLISTVLRVCERLASYQRDDKIAIVSPVSLTEPRPQKGSLDAAPDVEQRLTVDIARLIETGRNLMKTGRAEYAEKAFQRALATLDTIEPLCEGDNRVRGTTAMCLAWLSFSMLAQGKCTDSHAQRLRRDYEDFCREFLSDAARVCVTHRLIGALTIEWRGDTCSQKKLRDILAASPHNHEYRCALVVTLFLSGDLERCLTEVFKLRVLSVPFGAIALSAIQDYIGPEHPLMGVIRPSS
uniref:Uncharacterized protein TCIL3000_7_2600 n=1 Tax=Trypanosoma congolense (strain IL3000) TaxID=1068625 RepID=G0UPY9_TRYCI|nr:unnamed protein product [Trypanosoma congolense IL3000]